MVHYVYGVRSCETLLLTHCTYIHTTDTASTDDKPVKTLYPGNKEEVTHLYSHPQTGPH